LDVTKGVATVIAPGEVGNVSVNVNPVSAKSVFGLVIVKVRVEVPPVVIGFGANRLEIWGGRMAVRFALAEPPGPVFGPDSVDEIYPLTLL